MYYVFLVGFCGGLEDGLVPWTNRMFGRSIASQEHLLVHRHVSSQCGTVLSGGLCKYVLAILSVRFLDCLLARRSLCILCTTLLCLGMRMLWIIGFVQWLSKCDHVSIFFWSQSGQLGSLDSCFHIMFLLWFPIYCS